MFGTFGKFPTLNHVSIFGCCILSQTIYSAQNHNCNYVIVINRHALPLVLEEREVSHKMPMLLFGEMSLLTLPLMVTVCLCTYLALFSVQGKRRVF